MYNKHSLLGGLLLVAFSVTAFPATIPNLTVEYTAKGSFLLEARQVPLGKILEALHKKCAVSISGIDHRRTEPVTFSIKGVPLDIGLKRLLRYLGETSYAFKFFNEELRYVEIMPESPAAPLPPALPQANYPPRMESSDNDFPPPSPSSSAIASAASSDAESPEQNPTTQESLKTDGEISSPTPEFITTARIQEIMAESQAETIGLSKGDLIIKYDGVRITTSRELVDLVKQKAENEAVELTVIREGVPINFILTGGIIGIKIRTERVPKKDFNSIDW